MNWSNILPDITLGGSQPAGHIFSTACSPVRQRHHVWVSPVFAAPWVKIPFDLCGCYMMV